MGGVKLNIGGKTILFLILFFTHAYSAERQPRSGTEEVFRNETFIFENTKCEQGDTCHLKEFRLFVKKSRMWIEAGWHYGSNIIASYRTDSVDNLEKYSFVQFIRGCVFDTYIAEDGKINIMFGHSKPQFSDFDEGGQPVNFQKFCFPSWVIDSIDKDPVYASFPGLGRFYARRWNTVLGSYSRKTEKYYGEEKPKHPALYVRDTPTGAFLGESSAINVAMEFKMCIYKTEDIPKETTEDNINFAIAIKCFEWQNIYIYNYSKKTFEMRSEIGEFCLEPQKEN
jgi:hypothetical protein